MILETLNPGGVDFPSRPKNQGGENDGFTLMHGAAPILNSRQGVSSPAWNIVFQGEKSMTNMAISVLKEKITEIDKEIREQELQRIDLEKSIEILALSKKVKVNKIVVDSVNSHKSSKTISKVLEEENRPMNLTEITKKVVEDKKLHLKRNAVGAALNRLVKKGQVKRYETKPTTWSIP